MQNQKQQPESPDTTEALIVVFGAFDGRSHVEEAQAREMLGVESVRLHVSALQHVQLFLGSSFRGTV